jgi:prepilin-type processing-associated H-X9-DG protein
LYSNVYDDQFPPFDGAKGLEVLRKEGFLENARIFTCPTSDDEVQEKGKPLTEETVSYCYVGGLSEASPVNTILAYDKPNNHDKYGNVLFVDGHVKGYAGANWLETARKSAQQNSR